MKGYKAEFRVPKGKDGGEFCTEAFQLKVHKTWKVIVSRLQYTDMELMSCVFIYSVTHHIFIVHLLLSGMVPDFEDIRIRVTDTTPTLMEFTVQQGGKALNNLCVISAQREPQVAAVKTLTRKSICLFSSKELVQSITFL